MNPAEVIADFDAFLEARGLRFEAVLIGGAALNLLGVVRRPTRDCDVLEPELPPIIASAAQDFGTARGLHPEWLNNGPASLGRLLPAGWQKRLRRLYDGRALVLTTLGRSALLLTKLFALCCAIARPISTIAWRSPRPRPSYPRRSRGLSCRTRTRTGPRTFVRP